MPRQPDLTRYRAPDHRFELEVRTARHRRARDEIEPAAPAAPDGDALEGAREPIADARLRDDAFRVLRAERTAQFRDRVGDDVLDRRPPFPHGFEQLFLRDDLTGMGEQARQDFERLALDF